MRILYYLPSLFTSGGLERIITLKANYLAEVFGFDVIMLNSEQQGKIPYFPLSPRIQHLDLNVVFDARNGQPKALRLIQYPFKYYLFRKRFSRVLYHYRPDITITTLRRELNFLTSLNDRSIKIGEFHVTRHAYQAGSIQGSNILKRIIKNMWGKLFVRNLKKLSRLVLLTREEASLWPELTNTIVIHNPLSFKSETFSTCEQKRVIAVGRFSYQKGFDLLIDAWKIVYQRNPQWKLTIYGEGNRQPFQDQIDLNGLSDSCILEEPVTNIADKYTESSVFVLSSRFEGFGMVIVEAMTCGVPPVSFACPCGPKDIITDGHDGLLAEPENIRDLASKICFLIEHEDIRKEMGRKAKASAERFRVENIMHQWKELFESFV